MIFIFIFFLRDKALRCILVEVLNASCHIAEDAHTCGLEIDVLDFREVDLESAQQDDDDEGRQVALGHVTLLEPPGLLHGDCLQGSVHRFVLGEDEQDNQQDVDVSRVPFPPQNFAVEPLQHR